MEIKIIIDGEEYYIHRKSEETQDYTQESINLGDVATLKWCHYSENWPLRIKFNHQEDGFNYIHVNKIANFLADHGIIPTGYSKEIK